MAVVQQLFNNAASSCLTIMNKAFQNYSAIHLQYPACGSITKIETLPRRATICLVTREIPLRVFSRKFEPKLLCTVLPKFRMGLQCGEASINVFNFGSLGRLGSRSFSHFPRTAVSDRKNDQSPHAVDDKDVNLKISSLPARNKQSSITKGKVKRQSGSKKNNSEPTDAKEDVPTQKRRTTKKRQSPAIAEISSTVNPEVSDGNVLEKQQSSFSKKRIPRKEKSNEDDNALVKSDKLNNFSPTSNLQQNQSLNLGSKTKPEVQRVWPKLYPPTNKSVLVVESVTKAKIIQGYLGDMFEVLPSYGHIRDLAARSGSVRPDDDFSMVWEVPSKAWTRLLAIKGALSGAKNIILASDPDREGEAIAWHIIEMLQQQNALRDDITVARVVFNEITESSIKNALQVPREIDVNLVNAYLARRALDYLLGFNISPLLWRRLPSCQSAGRVQSAALALICDREMEIDKFEPLEYWTVQVEFSKKDNPSSANFYFSSHLTHYDSQKLNQHSIHSNSEANDIEQKITSSVFEVLSSKKSKKQKNPPPPYITSTLQQDAANRLDFTSAYTMKLAQKLYEGVQLSDGKATGLITYIRTDGLHISVEAAKGIQSFVRERYGQKFAPINPRTYFSKVKNAQEAHEAIRPTDIRRLPSMLIGVIDDDSLKLYTLIWSRALVCQMEPATVVQLEIDIGKSDQSIIFRSTCSNVDFQGHQAVYEDQETNSIRKHENEKDVRAKIFEVLSNNLKSGDQLFLGKTELKQHHTQHPSRYSEGSLVKKMEELGIGRPSTYASTIKVLKDRNYVTVKSRILYPEFRGRMVSAFLSHYFSEVADYCFTADMETELDNVSAGLTEWKGLLKDYWSRFSRYCEHVRNVPINQVEKMLEKTYGDFLFASLPNKSRTCPRCQEGTLIFKVSRFGAGYFIGCDQHPKCKYIAKTLYGEQEEETASEDNAKSIEEPVLLGVHPSSNEKVVVKNGPFGYYVQLGEDRAGHTPKRSSLSQVKDVSKLTLEDALEYLRYPLTLGKHPVDGRDVLMTVSLEGFKVRHTNTIFTLPKNMNPNEVTLEIALKLLSSKGVKKIGRQIRSKPKDEEASEGKVDGSVTLEDAPEVLHHPPVILGQHPADGNEVVLKHEKHGFAVSHGQTVAPIPKDLKPKDITLQKALKLLSKKKGRPRKPKLQGKGEVQHQV